jgi:quercetin dioxygenase-like cupin family protein
MVITETISYSRTRTLKNTIWYGASRMTFLATGADTDGQFAAIEVEASQGMEPPLHYHQREDEAVYILDGEIDFIVGSRSYSVGPGGFVFLPRGIAHTFHIRTETAKALVIITPAGFEEFFRRLGRPAESLDLPAAAPPARWWLERQAALAHEFGSVLVSGH